MASGAEAAKNLFDSAFNKTKEVLSTAADTTKGLANSAIENVQKIIPGQGNANAAADPAAQGVAPVAPADVVTTNPQ
ncbi:hypothetical protein M3Y99_01169500 [Aphelenchoides fujianensis]|nr:hypothetical protein M3Y99_01169500 [Aphelenchoides fujianensis]